MTNNQNQITNFARLLENITFKAAYIGKRDVPEINTVCNVILIDSSETKVTQDLRLLRERLDSFYCHKYWIGFGDKASSQLLIEKQNLLRGTYIFKIEGIEFKEHQILLKLEVVNRIYNLYSFSYIFVSLILASILVFWICSMFIVQFFYEVSKKIWLCINRSRGKIVYEIYDHCVK
ncbi:hypothetical protein ILUMI_13178 [Ignelater luminosus]|uniref:Uncharacterized protein n=1 Tax=Ignelater luminosus TaxID=2038154 RepID=A0A8K0CZ19_IGNLU|nr:hypothetical protein ILUMI_13178 [Ignelater luminosus]